jgi:hypothetical protein
VVHLRAGRDLLLLQRDQTGLQAHPASYPVGTSASSCGVKWPRRVADHLPTCNERMEEELQSSSRLFGMHRDTLPLFIAVGESVNVIIMTGLYLVLNRP